VRSAWSAIFGGGGPPETAYSWHSSAGVDIPPADKIRRAWPLIAVQTAQTTPSGTAGRKVSLCGFFLGFRVRMQPQTTDPASDPWRRSGIRPRVGSDDPRKKRSCRDARQCLPSRLNQPYLKARRSANSCSKRITDAVAPMALFIVKELILRKQIGIDVSRSRIARMHPHGKLSIAK
jgi:hypothetical protein